MLKVAILDDYQRVALRMADWASLGDDVDLTVLDHHLDNEDEAARVLRDFQVLCLMRERMPVSGSLMDRLPELKFISVTGPRNTVIDLAAASERGIPVSNTRSGGGIQAPSEFAIAMMLCCARNIPQEDRNVRAGGWQHTLGTLLHGKTLGLVGLGRLGQETGRLGRAFGMNILAWSPRLTAERAAAGGADLATKQELFARSDFVSIHIVLSERTRHLIGREEIALMKSTAILINTSRGPIVDEASLIEALRERRIRGAGLDVFDIEPLPLSHPLRSLDNVVLAPHLGFVVEEAFKRLYGDTVDNIRAWRSGNPIRLIND